jgi:8-oxo-dGTP diphosphatase
LPQTAKTQRSADNRSARPQIGVGVIVTRDRKVLLIRRQNSHGAGTWSTPGGHLEYGESLQACAIREAREETGVTITAPVFRAITNDLFEAEQKHYLTIWMEGAYVAGEPAVRASRELSSVGWFAWDALPEPLFLPFEHLLTGQCDPAPWNFSEEEPL